MGKQKKRKTVPAALHSEISEYASLLRVLRTTDTLDITTQLTRLDYPSSPRHAISVNEEETGRREASTLSHADRTGISSPSVEGHGRPSALDASIPPRMSRNTWTRWPLLTEDLHIPEWGFEDEVHSLAKKALLFDFSTSNRLPAADTASASRGVDPNVLSEDQIEALLPTSSLRTLADVSSSHLEHILSAMASYSPPVDKSTQHRRHPISWESVLNIVSAAGLVDGKYVVSQSQVNNGDIPRPIH
jgi:hypothetical protein